MGFNASRTRLVFQNSFGVFNDGHTHQNFCKQFNEFNQ